MPVACNINNMARKPNKPRLRIVGAEPQEAPARKPKTRGPILPGINVTAKEEAFAQAVAEGCSLAEAFRRSHDASGMKDETVWSQAMKVNNRDRVRARITFILDERQRETLHDKRRATEWALRRLQEEAEKAEQAGARVAAVQTVMRFHALLTDRQEIEQHDTRTTEQLRQELADALAQLAQPARRSA